MSSCALARLAVLWLCGSLGFVWAWSHSREAGDRAQRARLMGTRDRPAERAAAWLPVGYVIVWTLALLAAAIGSDR